jgi:hypothetical protein
LTGMQEVVFHREVVREVSFFHFIFRFIFSSFLRGNTDCYGKKDYRKHEKCPHVIIYCTIHNSRVLHCVI